MMKDMQPLNMERLIQAGKKTVRYALPILAAYGLVHGRDAAAKDPGDFLKPGDRTQVDTSQSLKYKVENELPYASEGQIVWDEVNVRTGPGIGNEDVGDLKKNDSVTFVGQFTPENDSTWFHVRYKDGEGWIIGDSVQPTEETVAAIANAAEDESTAVAQAAEDEPVRPPEPPTEVPGTEAAPVVEAPTEAPEHFIDPTVEGYGLVTPEVVAQRAWGDEIPAEIIESWSEGRIDYHYTGFWTEGFTSTDPAEQEMLPRALQQYTGDVIAYDPQTKRVQIDGFDGIVDLSNLNDFSVYITDNEGVPIRDPNKGGGFATTIIAVQPGDPLPIRIGDAIDISYGVMDDSMGWSTLPDGTKLFTPLELNVFGCLPQ
jgi:hypothetical protein